MKRFREDLTLRFDKCYGPKEEAVGGGSDVIIFRGRVDRKVRIRYYPSVKVLHAVEPWRLKRGYFLKLHYHGGLPYDRYQLPAYPRTVLGGPPFWLSHRLHQGAAGMHLTGRPGALRQAMNATNALGCLVGYAQRGEP